jgi:hypothetical protein
VGGFAHCKGLSLSFQDVSYTLQGLSSRRLLWHSDLNPPHERSNGKGREQRQGGAIRMAVNAEIRIKGEDARLGLKASV